MTISIPPNPTFLDGDFFTAAQVNHIQSELNRCVDGTGGTYVLSTDLTLGNVVIGTTGDIAIGPSSGSLICNDPASFNDGLDVGNTFTSSSIANLNGTVNIGLFSVQACNVNSTLNCSGNVEISSIDGAPHFTVFATTPTNLRGNVTIGAGSTETLLVHSASTTIDNDLSCGIFTCASISTPGSATITGSVRANAGGFIPRRQVHGANADTTYTITSGNYFYLDATELSGTKTWTISTTGALVGDEMEFVNWDSGSGTLIIANVKATGSFSSYPITARSAGLNFLRIIYRNGPSGFGWYCASYLAT